MLNYFNLYLITFLFSLFPQVALAGNDVDTTTWTQDPCDLLLTPDVKAFDSTAYQNSVQAFKAVHQPQEWIGKKYSFEEALAVVERHLEIVDPEMLKLYQSWMRSTFDQRQVVTRQGEEMKFSVRKVSPFWRKFEINPVSRKADLSFTWRPQLIQTELDLFWMEQNIIGLLAKEQYGRLRGLKAVRGQIDTLRDQLVFQYLLKGKQEMKPSLALKVDEYVNFVRSLSLDFLWPSGPKITPLNAFYAQIIDRQGVNGLSRYLYIKNGPKSALVFSLKSMAKLQVIAITAAAILYSGKIKDTYRYYSEVKQLEQIAPADRNEADRILKEMRGLPEINPEDSTLQKLTPEEQKEVLILVKAMKTELGQD